MVADRNLALTLVSTSSKLNRMRETVANPNSPWEIRLGKQGQKTEICRVVISSLVSRYCGYQKTIEICSNKANLKQENQVSKLVFV